MRQRFDLALLSRTLELSPAALRAGLAELTRAGITLEDPEAPGRFRFAHALVRDALYSELPPASRARRHLRAGRALERSVPFRGLSRLVMTSLCIGKSRQSL